MSEFTNNYPSRILASLHQLDFAPYVLGSYNAQWNAPKILHDKHILHSICILKKMEVEEPWLGLCLPLHY
ncbi:hypothetical protein GmHk_09G025391 [Glycine max]|nr:hypothetical protein GmHk_09G025391 [Glycine max]